MITQDVDAAEVGFDPTRLARIATHFKTYVDDGRLPGWSLALARQGQVAVLETYGYADVTMATPVTLDTIFRIYSMTKPITSVAAMMLWEEGLIDLNDPVSTYIPAFGHAKVWRSGSTNAPVLEPMNETMRLWHLMTHTSGLTYGYMYAHPVDDLYRRAGFEWGIKAGLDLATVCDRLAGLPLLFQPGAEWNYSMATDVLGRVVEVASGQRLDEFFRTRIFEPLGMADTGFHVPEGQQHRLARLYIPQSKTLQAIPAGDLGRPVLARPTFFGGGGGLVSTLSDYHRFATMLQRHGELDGVRLLGSRTIPYMALNHLPGGADLASFGRPLDAETAQDGVGFGLGFSVIIDAAATKSGASAGEFGWGGAASTLFWVDPTEEITGVFMTQLLPSRTHDLRRVMRRLVAQSLID